MLKIIKEEEEPWYNEGLAFKCTGCGKCCTGSPGYVYVTEADIEAIAKYLKIAPHEFARLFLRRVNGRMSLLEKPHPYEPDTYDCLFLTDKKCQIYQHRPTQCRTFPWWPQNLISPEAWLETANECEGINNEAPVISIEEIHEQLEMQINSRS